MSAAANRHRIAQVRARMAKARHESARATALAAANQVQRIERLQSQFQTETGETIGAAMGAQAGFSDRLDKAATQMVTIYRSASGKVDVAATNVHRTERALAMTAAALRTEAKRRARKGVPRISRKEDE